MKYNNKQNGFPNRLHEKTKKYVKNSFSYIQYITRDNMIMYVNIQTIL